MGQFVSNQPIPAQMFPITKSDTTVYDRPLTGLRINGAGSITFRCVDGNELTWDVVAGEVIVGFIDMVKDSTSATGITGLRSNA